MGLSEQRVRIGVRVRVRVRVKVGVGVGVGVRVGVRVRLGSVDRPPCGTSAAALLICTASPFSSAVIKVSRLSEYTENWG